MCEVGHGGVFRATCVNVRGSESETGVNWNKLRAEYIKGCSQARLAKKYHVSRNMIARHCSAEHWTEERIKAKAEIQQMVVQRTAEDVADNAVALERIKAKLLKKVEAMIDNFPETNAVEMRERIGNIDYVYKLKDLAAVCSALEDKIIKTSVDIEDLSPLTELLRDE